MMITENLSEFAPEKIKNVSNGNIENEDGETIGKHSGYINYTIGQRRGLGLSMPEPRYVKKILPNENKIIVSKKDNLLSTSCKLSNLNWMHKTSLPLECKVRIRYNSKGADAKLYKKNQYYCVFSEPQLAVTPGQSIVFYDNDSIIEGVSLKNKVSIIILAAGKGTRMKSDMPKVLHKVNGKSMVEHVILNARNLNPEKIIVVVGYKYRDGQKQLKNYDLTYAIQHEQNGTAHAVMQCEKSLKN